MTDTASPGSVADWTRGTPGVALQRCTACTHLWYFRRGFCPACGAQAPESLAAAGGGTVYATTVVHRAPDDAFKAIAPYALALVELDEGPRVMVHASADLAIGERVQLVFRTIAGRLLPFVQRQAPATGDTP